MVPLYVENTGTEPVFLTYYTALHSLRHFTLKNEQNVTRENPLLLKPGDNYKIQVYFHPYLVGFYVAILAFEFKPDLHPSSSPFYIVRFIEAYRPRPIPHWTSEAPSIIVDGKLPKNRMWRLRQKEIQLQEDIKRYNIPNSKQDYASMVKCSKDNNLLVLEVPGLSENGTSVTPGYELLVWPLGERGEKYRGYIHCVEQDRITLGFSPKLLLRFDDSMKFSVNFCINRLTLRIQHRVLEMASEYKQLLFPSVSHSPTQQPQLPRLSLFDSNLERNPEQYKAVQHIVAGSSRPAPYLVYGPPGTGKTVTLVEAIKQVVKLQPFSHILVCAPSNSATDFLCEKILADVENSQVLRMYACSHNRKTIPHELKECCNLEEDVYIFPSKDRLMEYRVIITTVFTAGRLVAANIPLGHFTHMFLDEAGRPFETECLIPVAGLLNVECTQLVLAGDPKQLGPVVKSPIAMKYGLGVSLLERLMNHISLYKKQNGKFNERFITKLLQNYRSHPAILEIPNELFYGGELQACADEKLCNTFCGWEYLPKKDFPVIFHGVIGHEKHDVNNPSFFNMAEVEVLMDYLKKLLEVQENKKFAIEPADIAIITPYNKQVRITSSEHKTFLEYNTCACQCVCQVGSVEEFLGEERKVIMVSTVRGGSFEYLTLDQQFDIGFLKNEKRFNVAVTRAKALMIVVGNPIVLNMYPAWSSFIRYCRMEGGYTGFGQAEKKEYKEDIEPMSIEPQEEDT
ncbi:hypothetical protein LDENG_00046930 [Lucifuga dentata]|nr:hypothetical protein LDENG_00046930 [Lucifuga dentata]